MGHWYDLTGQPCYTVIGTNGKRRDSTLRDARKYGWSPSVTEILKVASSDNLTEWRINQALKYAIENPFDPCCHTEESWISDIKGSCKTELQETSDKGSQIHDALETYYKTGEIPKQESIVGHIEIPGLNGCSYKTPIWSDGGKFLYEHVNAVIKLLTPLSDEWIAEESFCFEGKFGGKVDLHSKKDNLILDFKTKNTEKFDSVKGYSNHKMQLAAYAMGLYQTDARCFNVWIDVRNPGQVKLEEYTAEDIKEAWYMYRCLYTYWCHDRKFNLDKLG